MTINLKAYTNGNQVTITPTSNLMTPGTAQVISQAEDIITVQWDWNDEGTSQYQLTPTSVKRLAAGKPNCNIQATPIY